MLSRRTRFSVGQSMRFQSYLLKCNGKIVASGTRAQCEKKSEEIANNNPTEFFSFKIMPRMLDNTYQAA